MKFSISFVAVISTALFAVVHAAPAPLCNGELCSEVAAREVLDVSFDDLAVRAKKSSGSQKANISKGIQNVQKKQGQKPRQKQAKAAANNKLVQKNSGNIKKTVENFRKDQKAKGKLSPDQLNRKSDKLRNAEKSRVITNNQKAQKTARKDKWAAQKKTPDQKKANKAAQTARRADRKAKGEKAPPNQVSKKTKVSKEQRNNVKQRFRAANEKLRKTDNLPGRKATLKVGPHSTDGRAVRQSTFNNYLHSKTPIGRNPINKQPKSFNNRPYAKDHKDTSLRGKKPLPQNGKEYPIINKSPNGYTGQGDVGALRTVTYKQGGRNKVAVVGHDASRGRDPTDHYVATRELEFDLEDLE